MKQGFTLVELAIVIVIIGLLVGGVLQGQALIQQAKINSSISKLNSYNAAVNTFKAKYGGLPGDVKIASSAGLNTPKGSTTANVCSAAGEAVTATTGGNGNGDNFLNTVAGIGCTQAAGGSRSLYGGGAEGHRGEMANFFVHLSNVQLVKEAFFLPGTAMAPLTNNAAVEQYPGMPVGTGMIVLTEGGNQYWVLGTPKIMPNAINSAFANSLTPTEAYAIDSKLDDGNPLTGVVQVSTGLNASNLFVLATGAATTCVFTDNSYNMAGNYSDKNLCTIRVLGNF